MGILAALPFWAHAGGKGWPLEIIADLAAPHPMQRLLQGDVGSTGISAAGHGRRRGQARGRLDGAPGVLARRRLETITPLADAAGLRIGS